ncbi:MobA/MobL family protein [Eshraghiella crossota]|uniref:MobA/MobL family protein n=1 Tax=Eshraghiella crossota TaxID=45851 RepID=UPI003FD6F50D
MSIVRNSFIQMSKLTNLKGRINYISSHARQENLYAVYETTDRKFWTELAKCNQEEFKKSGTEGKCIEARELIIALPESFVDYEPDRLLKLFTEHFKQNYGVECIAALHHNKRKTNYHIHLIFSERKLLDEPVEKIATRNMFYDENGKHVRTKKEILDEVGQLRCGCKIIPKGEVYERNVFTIKDSRFKSAVFLDEVKRSYTDLINIYVRNDREKLKVFDKNGVYLPMKKVGKNNPKAEQIKADNQVRSMWNQTVDRALVCGVPEVQIMDVKQGEIGQKVKDSIQKSGRNPVLLKSIIMTAVYALELLIGKLFKRASQKDKGMETIVKAEPEQTAFKRGKAKSEPVAEMPKKSALASKYPRLADIYNKLERQNTALYEREQQLANVEKELAGTKGIFKAKQRKELQEQAEQIKTQIGNMKQYLSSIVQGYGYKNVKEFLTEYKASRAEYNNYQSAIAKWKQQTGNKVEPDNLKAKLQRKTQEVKERENNRQSHHYRADRGGR